MLLIDLITEDPKTLCKRYILEQGNCSSLLWHEAWHGVERSSCL